MGQRTASYAFKTEQEAKERAEQAQASAVTGYSEVYVIGPYQSKTDGLWHVNIKTYYG
jgi:hypothetical protein